ncbi:MAG: flavodoxin family protein [Clostridiales bacterium]|nr:flavodoxin family protein [Clostridiales bacterium]
MKRITILNGIPDDSYTEFEATLDGVAATENPDRRIDVIRLRDLDIRYCTGCWDCWVKTPGLCAHRDDMDTVYTSVMQSDLFVFLSPVSMGFVSSLTKKTCDRMIPLVHPYIVVYKEEFHHKTRYEKRPELGLILLDSDKNTVDFHNIRNIFSRLSINLQTDLTLALHLTGSEKEVYDEISTL